DMLTLMRHSVESATKILRRAGAPPELDRIVGQTILVVDLEMVSQIYIYQVGGAEVDTTNGKIELRLICGSKFMGYDVRSIYFTYHEQLDDHWDIDFFVPTHPKTGPAHYTQNSVEVTWSNSTP
ncbi:MAG TPA: hypothetical protein VJJ22_02295, partial [Candidatus Paceibacterota bacterium]